MDRITALFWDLGGVVLTNAWDRDYRKRAAEKFHLDWEDFEGRHELLLHGFETGRVSLEEYLNRAIFYQPREFSREEFKEFMFSLSQSYPESLAVLSRVSATKEYLLAVLNNESLELNEYRIRRFKLRDYFQVFLSSCYLGVRKPDQGIYRLALYITQREPGESIFVDDRPLNLECAKELGMHTIHYQNPAQLQDDLRPFGVLADGQ